MNKRTISVWLFAMLWLIFSCNNGTPPSNSVDKTPLKNELPPQGNAPLPTIRGDIYTQAAIETCSCMKPMISKAILLKKLEENHQTTEVKLLANEMVQLEPQIQKCSEAINQKYSQIKTSQDEKRIYAALIQECPDIETLNKMSKKH